MHRRVGVVTGGRPGWVRAVVGDSFELQFRGVAEAADTLDNSRSHAMARIERLDDPRWRIWDVRDLPVAIEDDEITRAVRLDEKGVAGFRSATGRQSGGDHPALFGEGDVEERRGLQPVQSLSPSLSVGLSGWRF